MHTNSKIVSMKLTPEDVRQLEFLKNLTGENQSQIMKRALYNYYHMRKSVHELFGEKEKKDSY